ncbi:thioester domain-containing protein [Streptomyces sp. NBC_00335]|uniref:thioester domain-containing protein n=1 Tax=unclassified Streptomyces TaxID=2593676 RepID=UPI002251CB39|nr:MULTISPECIES: thioester domain-containing protein [unclassified Streptomyces]MCX5407136.1 thioester domain-containing protein [Streptomyces sp. NBC_00086]
MSIAVPAPSVPVAVVGVAPVGAPGGVPVPAAGQACGAPATRTTVAAAIRGSVRRPIALALLAAALAGAPGAVAAADAGPAAPRTPEGASAVLDGLKTYGQAVLHGTDGTVRQIPAGLYEMRVDGGGMLQTYGVGVTGDAQPQARFTEAGWTGTPLAANGEAGRIRWVLEHSYPQLNDLAGLAKAAGAVALTAESAAAGTQVAIWRLAEGVRVEAVDPEAEKLADYLQRESRRLPEPPASLAVDPGEVSGPLGTRIGPVTVRTGAQSVSVTPDAAALAMGVRVVDARGLPVTSAVNGAKLFFEVPQGTPDGSAEVILRGSTRVPVGRVFTSGVPAQVQIVAGSSQSATVATATAQWPLLPAAQPVDAVAQSGATAALGTLGTLSESAATSDADTSEERLAASGSSAATPVIASLAVGLVVLGGLVVLLLRKRPLEDGPGPQRSADPE